MGQDDADPPIGPSSARRRLVLFVHGMNDLDRDANLDRVVAGMKRHIRTHNLDFEPPAEADDDVVGAGIPRFRRPDGFQIDVEVLYWGDLRPATSGIGPARKLLVGLELLAYWFGSLGFIRATLGHRYLAGSMLVTLGIFLFWYLTTLMLVTDQAAQPDWLPEWVIAASNRLNDLLPAIWGWVGLTAIMQLAPVEKVIGITGWAKAYLTNQKAGDSDGTGLRDKAVARLADRLWRADRSGRYDEIVVAAHSFGTALAVDVLADFRAKLDLRLVTMGSPLFVLQARDRRYKTLIADATTNDRVRRWEDFWSKQDWMCTAVPRVRDPDRPDARSTTEIPMAVSLGQRMTGASHWLYFDDDTVLSSLIA